MEKIRIVTGGLDNWYSQNLQANLDLIEAYIEQSEISNSIALSDYHKFKKIEVDEIANNTTFFYEFRLLDGKTFNTEYIYKDVFPNLNRHSTLVIVMGLFEKELVKLCERLKMKLDIKSNFKKNEHGKLYNIKEFLENEVKLKFCKKLNTYWDDLLVLQKIRNYIVHNSGCLEKSNNLIEKFMSSNKNITINESKEFVLSHIFLNELIPFFRNICLKLQTSINTRINSN